MRCVALRLPEWAWTGGVNYVESVCRALLAYPEFGYEPCVFCSPQIDAQLRRRLEELLGKRLVTHPDLARGRRAGLGSALALGSNPVMSALCARSGCDVLLEAADFYGWRFPAACLAWVPDFQDRHLPQLFSRRARLQRSLGLRLQLAAGRQVLLSSEDARADCERFYPGSRGRTAVARFAVHPALAPGDSDPQLRARLQLPERFFYLPNQFWTHKNHARVIEALQLLRERSLSIVVAASGEPQEPRQAGHFRGLRETVTARGLTQNFLFLGNVAVRDVALLMRASVALLNPSLFEGWSTTVEEGKALGVRMVLSDLAVHREQVGESADFFDPHDPLSIAACLESVWRRQLPAPTLEEQQAAAAQSAVRIRAFAQHFALACDQSLEPARRPVTRHVG
jgi:hypothetical protein